MSRRPCSGPPSITREFWWDRSPTSFVLASSGASRTTLRCSNDCEETTHPNRSAAWLPLCGIGGPRMLRDRVPDDAARRGHGGLAVRLRGPCVASGQDPQIPECSDQVIDERLADLFEQARPVDAHLQE